MLSPPAQAAPGRDATFIVEEPPQHLDAARALLDGDVVVSRRDVALADDDVRRG